MTTRRFQLDGDSVDALRERIRRDYGPAARIIALEKVTQGGIAGFLARQKYEATVEIDEAAGPTQQGIAAMIADAEEAEQTLGYDVSTTGTRFDAIMQNLETQTREPAEPPPPPAGTARVVPAPERRALSARPVYALPAPERSVADVVPLSAPGALIVFVGLDSLPLDSARAARGVLAVAGIERPRGIRPIDDRRSAYLARADAVAEDRPVHLAWRLSSALASTDELEGLAALQPDQVWVVVDARHKADDTARWVGAVTKTTPVDAVLAVGGDETASPETVAQLGIPRGRLPEMRDAERAETIG